MVFVVPSQPSETPSNAEIILVRTDHPFSFPDTLSRQLDNATGLYDLLFGQLAYISGADDNGELGQPSLAEQFCVAEVQQVDNGGCVLRLARDIFLAHMLGEERGELGGLH